MQNFIKLNLLLVWIFFFTPAELFSQIEYEISSEFNKKELSILGKIIGDKRIVMLGELDHGDGSTFIQKTRIIQYLHEELGFNIVAFEAPFSELAMLDEYNNMNIESAKKELYSLWSKVNETQELFSYMHKNSMTLTGFDSRHVSKRTLITDSIVKHFKLDTFDVAVKNNLEVLDTLLFNDYESYIKIDTIKQQEFIDFIDNLIAFQFSNTKNILVSNHSSFWVQMLNSLKGAALTCWEKDEYFSVLERDKYMADNLLWIINKKYPEDKIVIWAANYHIVANQYYLNGGDKNGYPRFQLMGDYIKENQGTNVVILPFIHSKGRSSFIKGKIRKKPVTSYERILGKNYEFAIVDVRKCNKKMSVNILGHENYVRSTYSNFFNVCDAFIFSKIVKKSSRIKIEK